MKGIQKNCIGIFAMACLLSCTVVNVENRWKHTQLKTQSLPGMSIRAIEVINDSTIYLAANVGQIGVTTDLGKTWDFQTLRQDTLKPSFRAIAKTDESVFIMSIESPALLYKWKDGVQTLVYEETHPDAFYDAMAFFDNQHGIAIGDPVGGCFSFLLTSDGGNTWNKIPCDKLPEMAAGESAYAASNTNIAIVGDEAWVATGGAVARVWHSKDKGQTWEVVETPIQHGGKMTGIYSVDFWDEKQGIVFGGDWDKKESNTANKAVTQDGGNTWQLVGDGVEPGFKSCVKYVPNSRGMKIVAVGTTGISFSEDAGRTWKQIHAEGFYTLRFVNETTAVLAGEEKFGVLTLN